MMMIMMMMMMMMMIIIIIVMIMVIMILKITIKDIGNFVKRFPRYFQPRAIHSYKISKVLKIDKTTRIVSP